MTRGNQYASSSEFLNKEPYQIPLFSMDCINCITILNDSFGNYTLGKYFPIFPRVRKKLKLPVLNVFSGNFCA
jgi:hypothetical protein